MMIIMIIMTKIAIIIIIIIIINLCKRTGIYFPFILLPFTELLYTAATVKF